MSSCNPTLTKRPSNLRDQFARWTMLKSSGKFNWLVDRLTLFWLEWLKAKFSPSLLAAYSLERTTSEQKSVGLRGGTHFGGCGNDTYWTWGYKANMQTHTHIKLGFAWFAFDKSAQIRRFFSISGVGNSKRGRSVTDLKDVLRDLMWKRCLHDERQSVQADDLSRMRAFC